MLTLNHKVLLSTKQGRLKATKKIPSGKDVEKMF